MAGFLGATTMDSSPFWLSTFWLPLRLALSVASSSTLSASSFVYDGRSSAVLLAF